MAIPSTCRSVPLLLSLLLAVFALSLVSQATIVAARKPAAPGSGGGASPVISSSVAASAVKALLLSKYSQAAPYLQILINTVNTVNGTLNAPYTLLVPLEALDYCTTIKKYPSQQLLPLMAYHIVKGRFTYSVMNGFKNGKTLSTISGRSLTRVTKRFVPLVIVEGQANDQAVVLAGDVYSTKTVTVHIISKMLKPWSS